MPELSPLIRGVVGGAEDDGWSVYYRAREMIRAGEDVLSLCVGDHDIKTDPAILAAMRASQDAGNLGYADVSGQRGLREAVAERVTARTAVPVRPEEVQITPGGQAALFAALVGVTGPGTSCIVLDPFYATYEQTVRSAGARPIVVPTDADQGFQPDAARIEAALAPDTRAILINTPNNPTGAVYAPERIAAIAALCVRHDLWCISDEVYDNQIHAGVHTGPRDMPGMVGRTVVVQSLSKSHAMTGSRIGWALGPAELVARLGELATTTTYGVPGFVQDAAEFALREGAAIEAAIAQRYRRRRDAVVEILGNGGPVGFVAPEGGMYVMLDIRRTGLSGIDFAERLLEAERIAVMPGESFGRAAAGHLRVALTRPEAVLRDALARILAFAEAVTEKA